MKDKELASILRDKGLSHEKAMEIVGLIAESNQQIWLEGYKHGYEEGYNDKKRL